MKKIFFILFVASILLVSFSLTFVKAVTEQELNEAKQIINSEVSCNKLTNEQLEIIGEYEFNGCQTAMLQQAITEARYDIEAPDYRVTFVLPEEYLKYIRHIPGALQILVSGK